MNFCLDRWGTVYAFILCGQQGSESEAKIQAWLLKFLFVLLQFIKAEYHSESTWFNDEFQCRPFSYRLEVNLTYTLPTILYSF